ncbi:MAG: hypothetical protein AAFZ15_30840 [Bacteroidota bacterium]
MKARNNFQEITNVKAFLAGFNAGHELCMNEKRLSKPVSVLLNSLLERDYNTSYQAGIHQGYAEGIKTKKLQLLKDKRGQYKEQETVEKPKQEQKVQPINDDLFNRINEFIGQHNKQLKDKEQEERHSQWLEDLQRDEELAKAQELDGDELSLH